MIVAVALVISLLVQGAVTRGILIGAAFGLVNLIVGAHFTRKALAGEPGAVLVNIAAGFGARFIVMIALLVLFTYASALGVSPAAFGFTFLAFVFVYFGIEAAIAFRLLNREAA